MYTKIFLIVVSIIFASACRSAGQGASFPVLPVIPSEKCEFKGTLEVNWSWWGAENEISNALQNQASKLGGNVVVRASERSGSAFYCPGYEISAR